MPNVFVLCTGRCGSVTFAKACGHATNFTSGHETRANMIGDHRLAYPPNHIEADNRLSWFLGRLDAAFGPTAYYVHLTRDPEAVAASYAKRIRKQQWSIIEAYRRSITLSPAAEDIDVCRDYVRTVTENIDAFLVRQQHVFRFRLEEAETAFPQFWEWARVTGDLDAAMNEWRARHNEHQDFPRPTVLQRLKRGVKAALADSD